MTKPAPKHKEAALPSGDGTGGFVPVAEIYIAQHAELIDAPNGEEIYPPEAKRLGIEGKVELKLGIDENGRVVQVKVIDARPATASTRPPPRRCAWPASSRP